MRGQEEKIPDDAAGCMPRPRFQHQHYKGFNYVIQYAFGFTSRQAP
jgi:hypothetical protein